jgi:hypothetical protein
MLSRSQNMSLHFERVVGRAIIDEGFRKRLISNPDETVKAEGFNLSQEELVKIRGAAKQGASTDVPTISASAASNW